MSVKSFVGGGALHCTTILYRFAVGNSCVVFYVFNGCVRDASDRDRVLPLVHRRVCHATYHQRLVH